MSHERLQSSRRSSSSCPTSTEGSVSSLTERVRQLRTDALPAYGEKATILKIDVRTGEHRCENLLKGKGAKEESESKVEVRNVASSNPPHKKPNLIIGIAL